MLVIMPGSKKRPLIKPIPTIVIKSNPFTKTEIFLLILFPFIIGSLFYISYVFTQQEYIQILQEVESSGTIYSRDALNNVFIFNKTEFIIVMKNKQYELVDFFDMAITIVNQSHDASNTITLYHWNVNYIEWLYRSDKYFANTIAKFDIPMKINGVSYTLKLKCVYWQDTILIAADGKEYYFSKFDDVKTYFDEIKKN